MSKSQRTKGAAGEREWCEFLQHTARRMGTVALVHRKVMRDAIQGVTWRGV